MDDKEIEETIKNFLGIFKHPTVEIVGFQFGKLGINGLNEEHPEHYIKLTVKHHSGMGRNEPEV